MGPGHGEELSFRPMGREDVPQLRAWLAEPHVAEWWDDASETIEGVEARYDDLVAADHHVVPWIMEIEGKPVGWIQWYRIEDELEWYPGIDVPPGTVGIDLAIGDPDYVGQGHGRRLVLEFVHHVLRASAPDCPEVWIDPDPQNQRAVRAYRAAGFVDTGIDLPDLERPGGRRRLMRMTWAGPAFR